MRLKLVTGSALAFAAATALSLSLAAPALAYQPGGPARESGSADGPSEGVLLSNQYFNLTRSAGIESIEFEGSALRDFSVEGRTATLIIDGEPAAAGRSSVPRASGVRPGISELSWEPVDGGTRLTLSFSRSPQYTVTNSMPGTELRPNTPQVIAAFSFPQAGDDKLGPNYSGAPPAGSLGRRDDPGSYELPKFAPYKYSDALVTLRANNVDFREVLWLLSRIGDVDIMLDPYWQQEPTGTRRPPGGGVQAGGDGNGGGSGFRSGGDFGPVGLTEGAGDLSFNFVDVPFDTALDLVIKSVGLVYVDINPGSLDS
ncbi:hypothetical protein IT575_13365 [bacterium]|nr:hypothetical protein [bacterium]